MTTTPPELERLTRHATPHGAFYLPDVPDTDVVAAAMKRGEVYDGFVVDAIRPWLRPGSTVLDVGSCFGQMAVLFARMVGPTGHVHTFEANPYLAALVRHNVAENGLTNVTVHHAAVWHSDRDELVFPVPDWSLRGSVGSFWVEEAARCQRPAWRVPTITIDSLGLDAACACMKVDVQGSDLNAMRGAVDTIRRSRMPVLFEHESKFDALFGQTFDDYMRFLDGVDYRVARALSVNNYLAVPR